jgi:hypothetical protein
MAFYYAIHNVAQAEFTGLNSLFSRQVSLFCQNNSLFC